MDGVVTQYTPDDIGRFIDTLGNLRSDTIICCHNLIEYDLPLLEKIHGYRHRGKILDTLVFSRLLNPERVGRHGLGSWGERFGRPKPTHEDWSVYSNDMLYRCSEDVEINYLVYQYLMKEAEMDEEELAKLPMY
jgi:DNA polymerase III alpha subunit (gram-positive type)